VSDEIWIERMTWTDVKAAMAAGKRRVLVIVGATEQHGPHLPIGTDTFLGHAMAERIARKLGDTLVAPVIPVGYSAGHMPMPGTITLSQETLSQVIVETCESLAHHGFDEIVILSSHGGNFRAIERVLGDLRDRVKPTRLLAATSVEPWLERNKRLAEEQGLDPVRAGVHAALNETSQMLAYKPELVKMERAVEGFMGDPSIRWRSKVPPPMNETSPTGILGDARGSTAELGEIFLEAETSHLADQIRAGQLD
jgi:creatinine amidohydrolase